MNGIEQISHKNCQTISANKMIIWQMLNIINIYNSQFFYFNSIINSSGSDLPEIKKKK
jgi:hypothetical protein